MYYFKLILFLIFNFVILYATTYEDAENATTSQWKRVNRDAFSSINNVLDKSKKSRVIEFTGAGTKQIYELYTSENKEGHEYWVSWDMKFSEDFVIILQIQSNLGKHYLIYTPGTLNSYMQYGLGRGTTNGKWRTFRRNIQKDIAYFDNRVKIVSLKRFVVKGNGMIDNIRTTLCSQNDNLDNGISKKKFKEKKKLIPSKRVIQEKKLIPKEKFILDEKLISNEELTPDENLTSEMQQEENLNKLTNSAPVIKMQGLKIVKLSLGEPYIEEGISAYDKEDGEIDVVTMENIYSNEPGRYMVLYMATDSDGNIAIDKRYVDVGDVKIKKKTNTSTKSEEVSSEEFDGEEVSREVLERGAPAGEEFQDEEEEELDEEEVSDLSKQAAQMRLWERKLELREKELARRRE